MNLFKKTQTIFLALLIALAIGACSKDDNKSSSSTGGGNGSGDNITGLGSGSVVISGDKTGEYSGYADFDLLDLGFGMITWDINIWNYPNQTFSLSIMTTNLAEGQTFPQPGEYKFRALEYNTTQTVFMGNVDIIENGDYLNAIEYSSLWHDGDAGKLIIESANAGQVKGSFEFYAHAIDDDDMEITGTIHVSGSFNAKKQE